jgi:hypothetical protein
MDEEIPKKFIDKAWQNYMDSHTTYPLKTGNWLHDLPSVKPMDMGKSQFILECHVNGKFYNKWLNYNNEDE